MATISSNATVTDAPKPFDSPKADIILRSSDGIDFRFFKVLLSLSSPLFSSMFDLPSAKADHDDLRRDGLPVLVVQEDSHVLTGLLGFLRPCGAPQFDTLELFSRVFQTADKYGMEDVMGALESMLMASKFMESEPGAVYAVACTYKLEKPARAAAKLTLRQSMLFPFSSMLESASAASLYRLIIYHQACVESALQALRTLALRNHPTPSRSCTCLWATSPLKGSEVLVKQWFWDYVQAISNDITRVLCGEAIHCVASRLSDVKACSYCREAAMMVFSRFVENLQDEVDVAVSQIKIEIKF
ncbi:hypothetical protein JAAARDRAFT_584667 [Jaapia argillacea MUCL 33604]|uniref:BTB domain-containing protein n=1 Tax=Jaapia argillacea MUCL 33604 TaxID=933084 RepID=A0A067P9G1_9AGAM|nr:hypothetical protein JAAARDRAFT_584667 [Jaapia argillacea MUCL 33604]